MALAEPGGWGPSDGVRARLVPSCDGVSKNHSNPVAASPWKPPEACNTLAFRKCHLPRAVTDAQQPCHNRGPLVGLLLTRQPTTTDGYRLQQVNKLAIAAIWTNQPIHFPACSISVGSLQQKRTNGAENMTREATSGAPASKPRLLAPGKAFARCR